MSPPERGSGRRRRRSHRKKRRHAHQQLAAHPQGAHAGPFDGNGHGRRQQRRPQLPQQQPQPQPQPQPEQLPEMPPVCPTWVFNPTSTAHVACDRHWFGDNYTPFKTWLTDSRGVKMEAIGVGNIMLPVDLLNGKRGEIFLRNVLHFPDAACNSIGHPIYIDYNIDGGDGMNFANDVQTLRDDQGRPRAYFERGSRMFYILKLGGPPPGTKLGPCPLDEGKGYMISLNWPESERMRFEASKEEARAFLSDSERAWLKKYWGNEFKFLAAYELSIYKDEEREEGRAIMRTMMVKEKESRENEDDDAHLVDHYFSDDELEEIELQFGNSKIFVEEELGLSIYNDEHCRAAKRDIREFLGKAG